TSTAKIDYAIGIPLTHLGHSGPVLPIYVNAYLPPQPTMERCYSFGQAVARTVTAMGLKTVILSSGGMSHFPGTDRYSNPELSSALHGLAHDPDKRARYMANAKGYADQFKLSPEQREALIKLDMAAMVKMGAHPLVPFLAQLQIDRLRARAQ